MARADQVPGAHFVRARLRWARRWAWASLASSLVFAVALASAWVVSARLAFGLSAPALAAPVLLLCSAWQVRLISAYSGDPARLGRESWVRGMRLLWVVLGALLATVVARVTVWELTGSTSRGHVLGFLLAGLLFAAPIGWLLEASNAQSVLTEPPAGLIPESEDPDLRWGRRRLSRAPAAAATALVLALAAAAAAGAFGHAAGWGTAQWALFALACLVVFASGAIGLRLVAAHAKDPARLGRVARHQALTLLWATAGGHGILTVAAMALSFHARELFLLPAVGFAASGLVLALPCGALLDASKVTTTITGR